MQTLKIQLNDGQAIPQLGFGTYQLTEALCERAVEFAIDTGYRHIDTASIYGNEVEVGRAVAASAVPRDELYITTKVWNDAHAAADTRQSVQDSLTRLGLDHVDLLLIHWPATVLYGDQYVECWDACQELRAQGLATSIGVSNFHDHHLAALHGAAPAVNQIELHPAFSQRELRAQATVRGIATVAWSPIGRGTFFDHPAIVEVCEQTGRTPAQVVLRWHIQHGIIAIPRSSNEERIAQNLNVFDFELTNDQMASIDSMDSPDGRTGADPDSAGF